jgi:hypothetical protein
MKKKEKKNDIWNFFKNDIEKINQYVLFGTWASVKSTRLFPALKNNPVSASVY